MNFDQTAVADSGIYRFGDGHVQTNSEVAKLRGASANSFEIFTKVSCDNE